jgi:hypothetical protein
LQLRASEFFASQQRKKDFPMNVIFLVAVVVLVFVLVRRNRGQ